MLYLPGYNAPIVLQFIRSDEFDEWLSGLADQAGKARILVRLRNAMSGHFGDFAPVGDGVMELRIHFGPGYRIYYIRRGETVYLLLCGGNKSSQARDILRARKMAREIRDMRS